MDISVADIKPLHFDNPVAEPLSFDDLIAKSEAPSPGTPIADSGTPSSDTPRFDNAPKTRKAPKKFRKRNSIVWKYFTIETINDGNKTARCKQCKNSFSYMKDFKLAGTSHLKRHITLEICPHGRLNMENGQGNQFGGDVSGSGAPRKRCRAMFPYDQGRSNQELAKMIILNNLPINIAEQPTFIDFMKTIQPQFRSIKSATVESACMDIYFKEKQSLMNLLASIPGRVSLSVELRTSDETIWYAILVGHFVDAEYKLNRRIVNVVKVPFPNSVFSYHLAIATCLSEWNLDPKLFTVTLDKTFTDDACRENLRGLLSLKNPSVINGQLLIGNCYSRIISALADFAIRFMESTVTKVRESIKYMKSSEVEKEKFMELKDKLQIPSSKSLNIDDVSKWNTTYEMLSTGLDLKEVFLFLKSSEQEYIEMPSLDDWDQVKTLCKYLKYFYDAINNLLDFDPYPTASSYFHEVWKLQHELSQASLTTDPFVHELVTPIKEFFEKYWDETSLILAIAVVMDPRFKMRLVKFSFTRIYGDDAEIWLRSVDQSLHDLYMEYFLQDLPNPTFEQEGDDIVATTMLPEEAQLQNSDEFADFDMYVTNRSKNAKLELDQYLEEPILPRVHEFDVLGWWKMNKINYPTLSKMAIDVLMIPFMTVDKDSAFNILTNKIDSYRTSLKATTLEALISAKDWLKYSGTSDSAVKMD